MAAKGNEAGNDLVKFLLCDFANFKPAIGGLGQAWTEAIEALTDVSDFDEKGAEPFRTEWFEIWADIPLLALAWCCGCCVAGRTLSAATGRTYEQELVNMCLTCCLGSCYHASVRTRMRTKYGLKGSKGMDCVLSWCCGGCLLCQEARELISRGDLHVPFAATKSAEPMAKVGAPVATEAVAYPPAATASPAVPVA